MGPGQACSCLCREQIDRGFVDVSETVLGLLQTEMSRDHPGGFLTRRPDSVNDLLDETALALDALCKHEVHERAPSPAYDTLIVAPVSVLAEFEIYGSRQIWPFVLQALFTAFDIGVSQFLRQRIPLIPLRSLWERMPITQWNDVPAERSGGR